MDFREEFEDKIVFSPRVELWAERLFLAALVILGGLLIYGMG